MEHAENKILNIENPEILTKEANPNNNDNTNQTENQNEIENVEGNSAENKLTKLSFPKRKYAIIHGYNGHNFCGNQK